VRFFLDNCISSRYAESLHILSERDGHSVVHLGSKFPRNAPDEVWLRALAAEGDWVIVSGDTRILTKPVLRREWERTRLTAFFLADGYMNSRYWTQIVFLMRWWPDILEQARLVEHGTGFEVPFRKSGRLKPIFSRR